VAHAEEAVVTSAPVDNSYEGVYRVAGSTSTGKSFSATLIVKAVGADTIQVDTEYAGFPISESGPATWNGTDEVSVPLSVTVPFVASGSGTVTLTRAEGGWQFFGTGSGDVFGSSGSATATGFGGGVAPTPAEVTEVTGISEPVQAIDEVLQPLQPADPQPSVATEASIQALALILILAFLWIFLSLILGGPLEVMGL
jgi:hypothetical protein